MRSINVRYLLTYLLLVCHVGSHACVCSRSVRRKGNSTTVTDVYINLLRNEDVIREAATSSSTVDGLVIYFFANETDKSRDHCTASTATPHRRPSDVTDIATLDTLGAQQGCDGT